LREIKATLEQRKPYLIVHEADPMHKGAPLKDLKLEFRDAEQCDALFMGRSPIVWHRIADFQVPCTPPPANYLARDLVRYGRCFSSARRWSR
jgi:hypothetical protein